MENAAAPYGINPVYQDKGDDCERWTKKDAQRNLNLTPTHFREELNAVREFIGQMEMREVYPEPEDENELTPAVALLKHRFSSQMFRVDGRSEQENIAEEKWFGELVVDWDDLLSEKLSGALARSALLAQLQHRRLEPLLLKMDPLSEGYKELARQEREHKKSYEDTLKRLTEVSPWRRNEDGKLSGRATVFSLIEAHRVYYAHNDRSLVDGIFAASEIQILLRQSQQTPEPQYRLGLVAYLNEAKRGLTNPRWTSQFTHKTLQALDYAFKNLNIEYSKKSGEELPDLLASGEYEKFPIPHPLPESPVYQ